MHVTNGKKAKAAVTRYGYRRGEFFEGYETRHGNCDVSDGSALADVRLACACNVTNPMIGCEMQYSRESFAAQSVEVVRNHADGARSSVVPKDRSEWKHPHEHAVAIEDVDGGAYGESQERRLVESSQAEQALRRRR